MTSDETSVRTASAPPPTTGEIVVGLDDSVSGAAALRWAAEQSRSTGLPLRVVHAWQLTAFEHAVASPELANAANADARARATRLVLDTLGGAAAKVRWSLDVVEGPPGPVLVARSDGALMLAVPGARHEGPSPLPCADGED